jgi:hypothetical protein
MRPAGVAVSKEGGPKPAPLGTNPAPHDKSDCTQGVQSTRKKGPKPAPEPAKTIPKLSEEEQAAAAAFSALGFNQPFGSPKFQKIWAEEYSSIPADANGSSVTDAMERAARRCQSLRITVPGIFFVTKRDVEKVESQNKFRRPVL